MDAKKPAQYSNNNEEEKEEILALHMEIHETLNVFNYITLTIYSILVEG